MNILKVKLRDFEHELSLSALVPMNYNVALTRIYLLKEPREVNNPHKGKAWGVIDALTKWRHHNTRAAIRLVQWAQENNRASINLIVNQQAAAEFDLYEKMGFVLWITELGHIYMGRDNE